jgi:hypothetical protein
VDSTGGELLPNVKYFVDGVEKTRREIQAIKPEDIESINVFKGEEASRKFGEAGLNAAVEIHLKKK